MAYVDGFMAAVPIANKEAYMAHARQAAAIFKRHGALKVVECWGDDVPEGKVTSMPMAVQKTEDEVVIFSWIIWPDKAVRDAGWQATMDDADTGKMPEMPFDGKRIISGGFDMILDL